MDFFVCLFHLKFLTGVTDLFLQQKPLRGTHPPQNTHIHSSPQLLSDSWAFKGTAHIYFGFKNPCEVFQFSLLTCAEFWILLSDGMICNLSVWFNVLYATKVLIRIYLASDSTVVYLLLMFVFSIILNILYLLPVSKVR